MPNKREEPADTAEQRIGPEIKRLRENADLSLRALAERAGFSASFISQLENGLVSPSIASLGKIASTLGVTLGDLFTTSGGYRLRRSSGPTQGPVSEVPGRKPVSRP